MRNPYTNTDLIDVDELIKEFKVVSIDEFSSYLKDIWRVNYIIILGPSAKK